MEVYVSVDRAAKEPLQCFKANDTGRVESHTLNVKITAELCESSFKPRLDDFEFRRVIHGMLPDAITGPHQID